MVATRRSGPVGDPSVGKSPSDRSEESSEAGQEEPRKLRSRRVSGDSGKRSTSPVEQPEVTSAKRQKTEESEPAEKVAEPLETKEPEEALNSPPPAEDAKLSSPLLEVKDEVLEETPAAAEKPEEGEGVGEDPARAPGRSPTVTVKQEGVEDLRMQMHLLRARRDAAEAMGKSMMGPSGSFSEPKWGDLISQYPEHPHAVVSGFCFTIGRSKTCNLRLPDSDVSGMLGRLILKGNVAYFENVGGTGSVSLNGKEAKRGERVPLKSGDELAFTGSKQFAYIFQQRQGVGIGRPGVSVSATDGSDLLRPMIPPRTRTPYIELIDKLSKITNPPRNPALKPPLPGRVPPPVVIDVVSRLRKLEEERDVLQENLERLQERAGSAERDAEKKDDMMDIHTPKEAEETTGVNGLSRDRSFEALLQAAGEASKVQKFDLDAPDEPEKVASPKQTEQLAKEDEEHAKEMDISEEERELRDEAAVRAVMEGEKLDAAAFEAKAEAAKAAAAARKSALRGTFAKTLIEPSDAGVSFSDFPYFLSETTKQLLIGSAFVHLKRSGFAKYTSSLVALSPRMLLAGASGTDIYQEKLVRALAGHFGAQLMIMQGASSEEEPSSPTEDEEPAEPAVALSAPEEAADTLEDAADPLIAEGAAREASQQAAEVPKAEADLCEPTKSAQEAPETVEALEKETVVTGQDAPTEMAIDGAEKVQDRHEKSPEMDLQKEPGKGSIEALRTSEQGGKAAAGGSAEADMVEGLPAQSELRVEDFSGTVEGVKGGTSRAGEALIKSFQAIRTKQSESTEGGAEGVLGEDSQAANDAEKLLGDAESGAVEVAKADGERMEEDAAALELKDERATSGLLASTRPEERGAQEKDVKKAQFFKRGDRVRFRGGPGAAGVSSSLHTYLCGLAAEKQLKSDPPIRGPCVGCRGTVELAYSPNHKVGVRFDKAVPGGSNLGNRCEEGHGFWCNGTNLELLETLDGVDTEGLRIDALFEVLSEASRKGPVILYIKDAERSIMGNLDKYLTLRKKLENLQGPIVAIASYTMPDVGKEKVHGGISAIHKFGGQQSALLELSFLNTLTRIEERGKEPPKISKVLEKLFPCKIKIQPPQKDSELHEWKKQIEQDVSILKAEANRAVLTKVLKDSNVGCQGLADLEVKDQLLTADQAQKVVGWGASHYLMMAEEPAVKKGKLQLSVESLRSGIELLRSVREDGSPLKKSLKDITLDDDFEKRLLSEVIPADEIGVAFDDIGALESVKETLKELVMLPLQRPELFSRGQLTRPCKGILLFGPPGTGKTMLAKAVATEAGANFINISMATIASKWFGEGEKYVKAVFTLASKLAPSIVFIDEVDSMLGRREKPGEHEAMRKIKNEFMANWDGLKTKERERVLVLAATNRPFDLDEAVVRRMPRRLMVSLPDAENRRKILQVILAKEELAETFDFHELSQLTDGYSGSDLKNLCVTAAYQPIREVLECERKDREKAKAEGRPWMAPSSESPPQIRPLNMSDMRLAKEQVCASVSADAASTSELEQWNDQYGEGGSRQKTQLSYFM